jgi:gliding motility-associated-like protein
MKTEQLNKILENLNEIPTERCWNSIENQLNIVMPTGSNTIEGSQLTSTKSSSIFSKIAAAPLKAAAITGSVIAVSTASIIAFYTLVDSPIVNNNTSDISNSTLVTQVDSLIEEQIPMEVIANKKENIKTPIVETPNSVVQPIQELQQAPSTSNSIIPITPVPPSSTIVTPQPKPNNSATTQIATTNTPKPIDPIIEHHSFEESIPIKITIPNVFTPNGDGYNDYFVIDGIENCTDSRLFIKSNSGQIVFQSSNYQNDWSGEHLPDGVYLYYFIYKVNNIEEKMSGRVIIKR